MKVIKRDGRIVDFDGNKITNAIYKAFAAEDDYNDTEAEYIAEYITYDIENDLVNWGSERISVEEIQDMVEEALIHHELFNVAKGYIKYRENRRIKRELGADIIDGVTSFLNNKNEEVMKENANKKKINVATHRDTLAGIVSKKVAETMIPQDILKEHLDGAIHIHDMDYYVSPITNCSLINLKDMFENGTKINDITIDTPKSLRTASTLATQIVACVASSQYGGTTISIAHLAPYVRVSKEKITNKFKNYGLEGEQLEKAINKELATEIRDSMQTLTYQINTYQLVTGQSVFLSLSLYLNEEPEYIEETAMLIEEIFKQRIEGFKNKFGVNTTPVFP